MKRSEMRDVPPRGGNPGLRHSASKTRVNALKAPSGLRANRKAVHMDNPLDDFIDAAARMLDLPLEPAWRAAVKANLQVTLRQGTLVAEFALPDDTEPAPVFQA